MKQEKLWQKDSTQLQAAVEAFTLGRDPEFDLLLAPFDVQGTRAHVQMLQKVGLISSLELDQILSGLDQIAFEIEAGTFQIEAGVEDVHSQIELLLTRRIGAPGKKIHTGRSRNDQVAVDIKLYLKAEVASIKNLVLNLFELLLDLSERHKDTLLPGYTHLQMAMPSSFGLWLGAYAEALVDDMTLLLSAEQIIDKNPLGSGAGYGSAFPIDRSLTTELLGFSALHVNAVYAQMSRGKTEKILAMALSNLGSTLARFAMDICLYLSPNFDFISFPSDWTTGSSIMPHKKNPDIFELIRAKCNRIQVVPTELSLLLTNLPSGYHRDLQLSKEILFPAITEMKHCLTMLQAALPHLQVKHRLLQDEKYKYLFSVEAVNALVKSGSSFRDAYRIVGNQVESGTFEWDSQNPLDHQHLGSIGNLGTELIRAAMQDLTA